MSFSLTSATRIAERLKGVEPASVMAVAVVESDGRSDLPDGRPQILFEAHIFSQKTKGRYDANYPLISSPTWNRALYRGGVGEYDRLRAAASLNKEAAYQSISMGLFQIMGFNHKACGFNSAVEMFQAISGPNDADMEAFVNFVSANPKMLDALRKKDWDTFALLYNGPGQVPYYAGKIADAYKQAKGVPVAAEMGGPPIPYAEPTQPAAPPPAVTAKGLITGGTVGLGGLSVLSENADRISSFTTGVTEALRGTITLWALLKGWGPTIIILVALGVGGWFAYRWFKAHRKGKLA